MGLAVNTIAGAVDGGHRAHLQVGRRDRLAVDEQAARPVTVGTRDQRAVVAQPGDAGDELDPRVVAVLEQHVGRAGRRVDAHDVERPLVARQHGGDQPGLAPLHVGEVRERVAIPLDVDDRAVEADDVQRHVGVGGAGRRVRQLARRLGRIGGIGEVPALHRRGVDPAHGQRAAVGRPPVATHAVHLLGGDEVGAAPRDRLGLVVVTTGEHAPPPVELGDAQQPAADVGDALGHGDRDGGRTPGRRRGARAPGR